ncbi:MAG: helix-turn-helix domain-containing protein [Defluviitaleaceae bacterium]|nr:helix-turn-helix domain-containing protein [Defluviitaleaceae bacterium]
MTLGERIQILRKQRGMSQEQLAAKILVTRQAVSKWELGESLPDVNNIVQISELFNVTTDFLLKNGAGDASADMAHDLEATGTKPPPAAVPAKSAKEARLSQQVNRLPVVIGIVGIVAASTAGFLHPNHSNMLFPIAGMATMVGLLIVFAPLFKEHALMDARLRLGRAMTDIGIIAIIISGISGLFIRSHASTILTYASVMAWVGLAIVVICLVRQFVNIKPFVQRAKDTDDLSKVLEQKPSDGN